MASFKDLRQLVDGQHLKPTVNLCCRFANRESQQPVFRGTRSNMGKNRTMPVAQKVDWKQGLVEEESTSCLCCNGPHNLRRCPTFKMKAVSSRQSFVKERSLCFNCLFPVIGFLRVGRRSNATGDNTLLHVEAESTEKEEIHYASCEDHDEKKELAPKASLFAASSQEMASDCSGA